MATKYWLCYALSQKSFHFENNIVFIYQIWGPSVEFRKCFTKFMISIAYFLEMVSIVDIFYIWTNTCKTNKTQSVYTIKKRERQKWQSNYFKIKIISFISF